MSLGASISGSISRHKQKSKINRVPSALTREEVRPVALGYRDLAEQTVKRTPGLSPQEVNTTREQAFKAVGGAKEGADMRARSAAARHGLSGGMLSNAMARNEQAAMEQMREAAVQVQLAEHAIRESDLVRQAAIAAQFLWPAEQARGAGQIQSTTTTGKQWSVEGSLSYGSPAQ